MAIEDHYYLGEDVAFRICYDGKFIFILGFQY